MANLQQILNCLGQSQKLGPGYLTPVGTATPNALETLIALKNQFDPFTRVQNPLPGMTNDVGAPNILFSPAYVSNAAGQPSAIFLDAVDGNLDFSHGVKQPAYVFVS
jgi:hypothetical protein